MDGRVRSYTEWDPLKEVIVGRALGSVDPPYEPVISPYVPRGDASRQFCGAWHDAAEVLAAEHQLDGLADRLQREGVRVERPDPVDNTAGHATPDFESPAGHGQACPRDVLLVVGDTIIEVPMATRARYFEFRAYRALIREYFAAGARWVTGPRPLLSDDQYDLDYSSEDGPYKYGSHQPLTDLDPCFDGACFMRFGRDIFWQPDVVSNTSGITWLQRQLGPAYRIHPIQFADVAPQHIDTTLVPIRPGLVLVNPERPCVDGSLELFKRDGWRIVEGPPSVREGLPFAARDVSNWISLNILSLDERTVVAEAAEEPLHALLGSLGCEVIPVEFDAVFRFGGSFHCCTLDVRRDGEMRSYFPSLG
jgi:glycine amidinotransferase